MASDSQKVNICLIAVCPMWVAHAQTRLPIVMGKHCENDLLINGKFHLIFFGYNSIFYWVTVFVSSKYNQPESCAEDIE